VTAKENNTVILPCKVSGYPPPTVTWSKNNDVSAVKQGVLTSNGLLLVDVHVVDTGNYTCKAESILGTQEKVVELIVKGMIRSINSLNVLPIHILLLRVSTVVKKRLQTSYCIAS
jgi:hypothetical protein